MPRNIIREIKWQIGDAINEYVASLPTVERAKFYTQILTRSKKLGLTKFFKTEDSELLLDLAYDWLLDEPSQQIENSKPHLEKLYAGSGPEVQHSIRALIMIHGVGLSAEFLKEQLILNARSNKIRNWERIEIAILQIKLLRKNGKENLIKKEILDFYNLKDFPQMAPIHLAYYQETDKIKTLKILNDIQNNVRFVLEDDCQRFYRNSIAVTLQNIPVDNKEIDYLILLRKIKHTKLKKIIDDVLKIEFFEALRKKYEDMPDIADIEIGRENPIKSGSLWEVAILKTKGDKKELKSNTISIISRKEWWADIELVIKNARKYRHDPVVLNRVKLVLEEVMKYRLRSFMDHLNKLNIDYESVDGIITYDDEDTLSLQPDWKFKPGANEEFNVVEEVNSLEKEWGL